jgi:DNA-binding transcriptional ArsR family regulator
MAEPPVNPVGDLELTDPQAMRALARPGRLALLDRLRREGEATAARLASDGAESPAEIEEHLGELERHGLVSRSAGGWSAAGKGFVFEVPEDPVGQAAARELSNVMLLHYVDLPKRWVAEAEPRLELDWVRAAGLLNARVRITAEELREIQDQLERLLEPVIARGPDEVPDNAAPVRILSYFLPEPGADSLR